MSRWSLPLAALLACANGEEDAVATTGSAAAETSSAGACSSAPISTSPSTSNPFAAHALAPEQRHWLEGAVEESLAAGSYVYVRVRTAEGDVWVASLAATTPRPPPERARVLVVGSAERFHSRRLGRDFCPLAFGVIRADSKNLPPLQQGTDS